MFVKIYALIWVLTMVAAGVLYFTGFFSAGRAVIFGLLCFGLVYIGMLFFEFAENENEMWKN